MTSSLTENDLNTLTLRCCTNLLLAGVIKQLESSPQNVDTFKV